MNDNGESKEMSEKELPKVFIFEGGDVCGKTTQLEKIYDELCKRKNENLEVYKFKFPNRLIKLNLDTEGKSFLPDDIINDLTYLRDNGIISVNENFEWNIYSIFDALHKYIYNSSIDDIIKNWELILKLMKADIVLNALDKFNWITKTYADIVKSKKELNQCKSEYDILMDEMSNRAKTIKNILSLISVEQFEKYLKLNESLYKGIIKSGIKIKNNELSITKEEFIEHVIIDHSIKKREINEIIEEINSYQEKINLYNKSLQELERQYPSISDEYKKNVDKLNTVIKEKIMLEDSCKEIEKTIQDNLERIEKETLQEKELLQTENNIPFYKQQIVYINEKIVALEKEKKRLEENYISNEKNYITKN